MELLADKLAENWQRQAREGFLLSAPQTARIEIRHVQDPECGVRYRFLWMPHREIRGDIPALERRGILNPQRDERRLYRDARDPHRRHCFLCAENIRECHPKERLIPLILAGQEHYAGANFAWIERDHYTVMSAAHTDQIYSRQVLAAMLDLHRQTGGRFRVLFNGPGAGATIPWHLHYQITTAELPIETMPSGSEPRYPTTVQRFAALDGGFEQAHLSAETWLQRDPDRHSLNIILATLDDETWIFIFPRDQQRAGTERKGLVGGFEVAGAFVLSAPQERTVYRDASLETAHAILNQIRPAS